MSQPLQIVISGDTAEEVKSKYIEMGKALGLSLSSQATSAPAGQSTQVASSTPPADAPSTEKTTKGKKAKEVETPPAQTNIFGDDAPPAATVTKEDVRTALSDVNNTKGTPAAMAVLKEFGAESMSGLKEKDFAGFVAKCKEVVAAK